MIATLINPMRCTKYYSNHFNFLQYIIISSAFILCPTAIIYAHTQDSTNQEASAQRSKVVRRL
jgi:hypothetical protein